MVEVADDLAWSEGEFGHGFVPPRLTDVEKVASLILAEDRDAAAFNPDICNEYFLHDLFIG